MRVKRSLNWKSYFLLNFNPVVRWLILSDLVWMGAIGLLTPIFALFIEDFIEGGNAAVAGTAAAVYLITKSVLQIPIAAVLDKIRGEKDDFWIMFSGTILASLIPLSYLVISTPAQLYAVQFVYGVLLASTFPSFMAIMTRHVDNHKEASTWGVYYTLTDFTSAATAAIGGVVVSTAGFPVLITGMVMVSFLGAALLYPIRFQLKRI
jgi:MFS family permease